MRFIRCHRQINTTNENESPSTPAWRWSGMNEIKTKCQMMCEPQKVCRESFPLINSKQIARKLSQADICIVDRETLFHLHWSLKFIPKISCRIIPRYTMKDTRENSLLTESRPSCNWMDCKIRLKHRRAFCQVMFSCETQSTERSRHTENVICNLQTVYILIQL